MGRSARNHRLQRGSRPRDQSNKSTPRRTWHPPRRITRREARNALSNKDLLREMCRELGGVPEETLRSFLQNRLH